jgi:hypothetical protein
MIKDMFAKMVGKVIEAEYYEVPKFRGMKLMDHPEIIESGSIRQTLTVYVGEHAHSIVFDEALVSHDIVSSLRHLANDIEKQNAPFYWPKGVNNAHARNKTDNAKARS